MENNTLTLIFESQYERTQFVEFLYRLQHEMRLSLESPEYENAEAVDSLRVSNLGGYEYL